MRANILIADAQKHYRDFLRRTLQSEPTVAVVAEAASGEQAIQLAELLKPDLILVDMDAPEMRGLDVTRRVKRGGQNVKVILMSLLGDNGHRQAALASGADGFVAKSAPITELFSSIWSVAGPARKTTAGAD